jgi:fatty-acyl-CoA synthase
MLVGDVPRRNADRWPDREAVVDATRAGNEARLTHAAWNRRINALADGLARRGVGTGDRVALHTYNSLPEVTTYLATAKLGAVTVPTNHRLAAGELEHILEGAEADWLIYDPDLEDTVAGADHDCHRIATAAVSRRTDDPELADERYEAVVADGDPAEPDRPDIEPAATSILMHTSGTTGLPKLVEVTHRGQWMNAMSNVPELGWRFGDRALNLAPLYHSAGYFNNFLPCLQLGGTNVVVADFDPERALSLLAAESITAFLGVPTHFQRFRTADVDAPAAEALRFVVSTGASLSDPTLDWVREHLTERFVNVYGLTESTGFVTLLRPAEFDRLDRGYCIGEPFHGVDVRVVEPAEDASPADTVDRGERGQLICRSDKLMSGYYGQPDRTAEALRDGWLFTGDVVRRDESGYCYLIDRMDNCIVTGGENVYPAEVERVLDTAPGVAESAVVGEPDEEWGEVVVAYVVRSDPSLSAADLDAFWDDQTRLADFKRPREVRFVNEIPTNPSGKILRDRLD